MKEKNAINLKNIMCLIIEPNGTFIHTNSQKEEHNHWQSFYRMLLETPDNIRPLFDINYQFPYSESYSIMKYYTTYGYVVYTKDQAGDCGEMINGLLFLPNKITIPQQEIILNLLSSFHNLSDFCIGVNQEDRLSTRLYSSLYPTKEEACDEAYELIQQIPIVQKESIK